MTSQPNSGQRIGENQGDDTEVTREVKALFERLGDWGLGRLMELAQAEMASRIKAAEKKVAEMKQHFRLPEASPAQAPSPRKQRMKSTKEKLTKMAGAEKPSSGTRGKLRSTILELLGEGPKRRAALEQELSKRGIPTKSAGTTINRLKKDNVVTHDKQSKVYSLSSLNCNGVDQE